MFYFITSTDLLKVFAENNLRILVNSSEMEDLKIPRINDVYASESSEDDDDEEKRKTFEDVERRALKSSQKRQWTKRRDDILWEYYEKTWYSVPVSF